MQVATSRLDIVNETDAFTQKVQHQADHLRQLKKRAMSIPVIGSIVGTVGGILLIKMLMGKRAIRPRRVRACPDCPEDWSIPPYSGS